MEPVEYHLQQLEDDHGDAARVLSQPVAVTIVIMTVPPPITNHSDSECLRQFTDCRLQSPTRIAGRYEIMVLSLAHDEALRQRLVQC